MTGRTVDDSQPQARRPWEVFERESSDRPPNELRYSGAVWLAIFVVILSIVTAALTVPANDRQMEFLDTVKAAEESGFPQVPPIYIGNETSDFIEEWNIDCDATINGMSHCYYVTAFAEQRIEYEEERGLWFLGAGAGFVVILFLVAIAFSRLLNNLYALGFEMSYIPPAWAFAGFLVPIMNMVLPWLVVTRLWSAAWVRSGWPVGIVSVAWGVMAAVTVIFNPWVTGWIIPRSDIDGWITSLQWVAYATTWTAAAAVFTSAVLLTVAWRQERRFRALDAAARA